MCPTHYPPIRDGYPSMNKMIATCVAITIMVFTEVQARDYISIVGSSTVYPFATVVAEQFGKATRYKTPIIESTGSGGGFKLFCAGVGVQYPDIINSSRRIKSSEVEQCARNGVAAIVEVKFGYDGIVLAHAKNAPRIALTLEQIFMAITKNVPVDRNGPALQLNPANTWRDVADHLLPIPIEVMGPPPTSGTRDAFAELALEGGCKQIRWIKALQKTDKKHYRRICHTVREDGVYIESGENDNLIVQKLEINPNALGIFGYSFLDQNADRVRGIHINGVEPTFENIADGIYPISRPLYFYVKKAHVEAIPGIREFLHEFTSEGTWGDDGYLTDKGLIPMPTEERSRFRSSVRNLSNLKL